MIKYGGHAQAGGFSLREENLQTFMQRYNDFFCEHYPLSTWIPEVACDVVVDPEDISVPLAESFSAMAPFGMGNPTPTVLYENVRVISSAPLGKTGDHAKYILEKDQHTTEMIAFRITGKDMPLPNQRIDVSAVLELDEFRQVKRAKSLYKQHRIHVEALGELVSSIECEMIYGLAKALPSLTVTHLDYQDYYDSVHRHPFGNYACCLTPDVAKQVLLQAKDDGSLALVELCLLQYPHNKHRLNAVLIGGGAWRKEVPVLDSHEQIKSVVSKMRLCREDLIRVYLKCKHIGSGSMNFQSRCGLLAEQAEVNAWQAAAALAVFEELGFLSFEQTTLWVDPRPKKKDLEESKIYTTLWKGW